MGLIQMEALISTQKNIEHGIHYTSESRQEKMSCDILTSLPIELMSVECEGCVT